MGDKYCPRILYVIIRQGHASVLRPSITLLKKKREWNIKKIHINILLA